MWEKGHEKRVQKVEFQKRQEQRRGIELGEASGHRIPCVLSED